MVCDSPGCPSELSLSRWADFGGLSGGLVVFAPTSLERREAVTDAADNGDWNVEPREREGREQTYTPRCMYARPPARGHRYGPEYLAPQACPPFMRCGPLHTRPEYSP